MTTAVSAAPTDRPEADQWRGEPIAATRSAVRPAEPDSWSRALGWFSIGLGVAQIAAPRAMARLIGVPDDHTTRNTMLALGLRELTSGVGILSRPESSAWRWSRVGGDIMDLALLGRALETDGADRERVLAATAAVVGVTLLDVLASRSVGDAGPASDTRQAAAARTQPVIRTITINHAPDEVYRFWRNFENLPRFMQHLESVEVLDDRRSHWKAAAPAGRTVEWDAEITEDRPGELIAWRSLEGADISHSGRVRFLKAPGDRGTEVHVELHYDPPAGKLGTAVAKLFGEEPGQQVDRDIRRFKQVMETGEVVLSREPTP